MNSFRTILSYLAVRSSLLLSRVPIRPLQGANCRTWFATLLLLAVLLSGCQVYKAAGPAADYYYLNPHKDLSVVGRVALVELDNESSYPQISANVTEAFYQALQKKQIFGLTIVHQNYPPWRGLQLNSDSESHFANSYKMGPLSTYTLEQLSAIRQALKCDAVLTGTITGYQPYPHMAIGLRLKLIDLKDGQLLWALEQIWDSADKTTERRIKSYFQHQMRSGFEPLRERLVTVSSLRFINFVAYEVAETFQLDCQM